MTLASENILNRAKFIYYFLLWDYNKPNIQYDYYTKSGAWKFVNPVAFSIFVHEYDLKPHQISISLQIFVLFWDLLGIVDDFFLYVSGRCFFFFLITMTILIVFKCCCFVGSLWARLYIMISKLSCIVKISSSILIWYFPHSIKRSPDVYCTLTYQAFLVTCPLFTLSVSNILLVKQPSPWKRRRFLR